MNLSKPLAAALMATTFLALSPSLPALAETLTVTDIVVGSGPISITIPQIEVIDGNISEADIRAAFELGDLAAIAKSVSTWDAASIRIPELSFRQVIQSPDKPDTIAETAYRNTEIDNLQDGVAQSWRVESSETKTAGKEAVDVSFGPMSIGSTDFGALVGLYAGGGGEMKTIYENAVLEGGKITGPDGLACDIGKIVAGAFKARPLQTSLVDFISLAQSLEGDETPSPSEIQKLVGFYSDIFQGMDVAPVTSDGISCKIVDKDGYSGTMSLGKFEFEGMGKGRYGGVTLHDLDFTIDGQGFFRAGKLAFKGIDVNAPLDTLKSVGTALSETWFEENFRKLIPSFDGFAVEAVNLDVPDEVDPGQRVKGSIGAFDLTLKAYRLGIPTDISITADKVAIDLPANSADEQVAKLKALGYDHIELSSATKLHWDEASKTIVIDEVSTSGADMGSFIFSAVIGNAREELFAEDPQIMQAAALGLSVKELNIATKDDGLGEKIFALVGKEQGQDAAAVRTQVSGVAGGMVPMLLGGTEQAQEVGNAVMTFLNGGSSLKITAVAKDAAGLGFVDFLAAQQNPSALAEKVDIKAEAQ